MGLYNHEGAVKKNTTGRMDKHRAKILPTTDVSGKDVACGDC